MNTSPPILFGSVCSGIEAASVAWHPLGWRAAWLSEIDKFASALLAHHYPDVPNLGDMTRLPARIASGDVPAPDVFCGGTPCQAFSVAGLRRSLDDARGNLSLTYCEILNAIDTVRVARGEPECVAFWENVPGVLSTKDNAFGCFLAGLAGEDDPLEPPGGKWTNAGAVFGPQRTVAWRVTDAQYFGVAQRRRRVFVVASARKGFDPLAVLFELDGVRRDSAPRRQTGQDAAGGTLRSTDGGSDVDHARAQHLIASGNAEGSTGLPFLTCSNIGKTVNNQTPLMAFTTKLHNTASNQSGKVYEEYATSLDANSPPPALLTAMQVRRLTPRECERLQGFPDDYTLIPWRTYQEAARKGASYEGLLQSRGMTLRGPSIEECPNGPRYKALGNSWAVPNVRWIGQRIAAQLSDT